MTHPNDTKAAAEYGEQMKVLRGQFVGTSERLAMAFLAGVDWARKNPVKTLEELNAEFEKHRHLFEKAAQQQGEK